MEGISRSKHCSLGVQSVLWEHVLFIQLWLDTGSKVGQGRGGGGEGSGSLDDMKRFYFILQEIQRHEGLELGRNMIISELFTN